MENKQDNTADFWSKIEIYCINEKCGDPVPSMYGEVHYSKRKMIMCGKKTLSAAVFMCPVCQRKKYFEKKFFDDDLIEISKERYDKISCFIATEVYGFHDSQEVILFKEFRDEVLLKFNIGRLFIRLYYKYIGPIGLWIIRIFGKQMRLITKVFLDLILYYIIPICYRLK